MAMTSQQRYDLLVNQDRMGVTTGQQQRLLAAINAGEISIEEALPPITSSGNSMMTFGGSNVTPAPAPSGPQIGFGGSYVGPVSEPTPTDPGMLTPTTTTPTNAPDVTATESPVTTTQDDLLNQNFINLLAQLGLANLVAGFGGQAQQEPATVPQGMLSNQFGVAPRRQGYLPPLVVQPSSIAQDTGLLQYIVNQGQ